MAAPKAQKLFVLAQVVNITKHLEIYMMQLQLKLEITKQNLVIMVLVLIAMHPALQYKVFGRQIQICMITPMLQILELQHWVFQILLIIILKNVQEPA